MTHDDLNAQRPGYVVELCPAGQHLVSSLCWFNDRKGIRSVDARGYVVNKAAQNCNFALKFNFVKGLKLYNQTNPEIKHLKLSNRIEKFKDKIRKQMAKFNDFRKDMRVKFQWFQIYISVQYQWFTEIYAWQIVNNFLRDMHDKFQWL